MINSMRFGNFRKTERAGFDARKFLGSSSSAFPVGTWPLTNDKADPSFLLVRRCHQLSNCIENNLELSVFFSNASSARGRSSWVASIYRNPTKEVLRKLRTSSNEASTGRRPWSSAKADTTIQVRREETAFRQLPVSGLFWVDSPD